MTLTQSCRILKTPGSHVLYRCVKYMISISHMLSRNSVRLWYTVIWWSTFHRDKKCLFCSSSQVSYFVISLNSLNCKHHQRGISVTFHTCPQWLLRSTAALVYVLANKFLPRSPCWPNLPMHQRFSSKAVGFLWPSEIIWPDLQSKLFFRLRNGFWQRDLVKCIFQRHSFCCCTSS